MAHSIKNIMMGLEGGIYVVNKGIEAKNQDEVKEGWEMVLLNFDKISHIVKDILYCSKEREPNLQRDQAQRDRDAGLQALQGRCCKLCHRNQTRPG